MHNLHAAAYDRDQITCTTGFINKLRTVVTIGEQHSVLFINGSKELWVKIFKLYDCSIHGLRVHGLFILTLLFNKPDSLHNLVIILQPYGR